MDSTSNKPMIIVIIVVAVVVAIIIIALIVSALKGGGQKEPQAELTSPIVVAADNLGGAEPAVAGVYKDSILKSVNSGLDFETDFWIGTDTELGAVDVLGITFHPDSEGAIIVSTYDDGLFMREEGDEQWQPIAFPYQKIYSFILDANDPDNRAFASGVVDGNGRIFRTTDEGESWRTVYAEPGDNTVVSALTQDPRNADIIIAGTSKGTLVRSTDGGDTWKNIGQEISGNISHFAHDAQKNSFMYLLAKGGKVYHSYDAGQTWIDWEDVKDEEIKSLNERASELSKAGNKDGAEALKDQAKALRDRNKTEKTPSGIINIIPDPNTTGVLYATLSKGVYRSSNFGKYWKQINIIESAERYPIPSVAINPDDSNEISFVAGDTFYRSTNYGSTWSVTPLDKTRNASFVAYDPFDTTIIYLGLSAKK
jgi:photosystem II stability/assembly factor-like uncharacterized protein